LSPGAAARMVHLGGSVEEAQHWAMHDFAPAPGYYGAIAYRDRARAVEFHPLVTVQQLLASL